MADKSHADERLYDLNFLVAFASQVCFVVANTLMAHYARWIEFLGGDLTEVGWIMGAGAAVGLLLRPWMAQWINEIGAKRMWGLGYAVFSVASMANLWIDSLGFTIYLVRSTIVLGAAIVFASGITYIAQIAPDRRRTEAIGILGVGGFVGMAVGPFLGDLFLGSGIRIRGNYSNLFLVATLSSLLPAILLLFLRAPDHVRPERSVRFLDFIATVRKYWPGAIVYVDLAFGLCMTAPFVYVASFIDNEQAPLRIVGVSEIGFFFWCYAGIAIIVRTALRRLPDRVGARRMLLVGMLFMGFGMFTFGVVGESRPWLLSVPALLTGVGHGLTFHTMTSLTIAPFPNAVRGTGSALALMMLDLGMLAGAPILGLIGDAFGFVALFSTIGLMCLGTTFVYWRSG